MNTVKKLTLIEGSFSNEEAGEILSNIFAAKIQFHTMKNFSSQERFGTEDKTAKKRIPALKKELEKLGQIISNAKLHNKKLVITSNIHITLKDA